VECRHTAMSIRLTEMTKFYKALSPDAQRNENSYYFLFNSSLTLLCSNFTTVKLFICLESYSSLNFALIIVIFLICT
jgi:hypothetical protein